jgi:hypothetical protein
MHTKRPGPCGRVFVLDSRAQAQTSETPSLVIK